MLIYTIDWSMVNKEKTVILIYGGGGHQEQMTRLLSGLENLNKAEIEFISICNSDVSKPITDKSYIVSFPLFKKSFGEIYKILLVIPRLFFVTYELVKNHRFKYIITTGPGIGAVFSFIMKLLGKRIIYVETWSRFYSRSLSGRICYYFAHYFFIQNRELTPLYPKALFKGRL